MKLTQQETWPTFAILLSSKHSEDVSKYRVQTALIDCLAKVLKTTVVLWWFVCLPSISAHILTWGFVFHDYSNSHHIITEAVNHHNHHELLKNKNIIIITIHHHQHQHQLCYHHRRHQKHRSFSWHSDQLHPAVLKLTAPSSSWPLQAANFTDLKIYMPSTRQMSLKLGAMRTFGWVPWKKGFQWNLRCLMKPELCTFEGLSKCKLFLVSYFAILALRLSVV